MKKLFSLILALAITISSFALTGCSKEKTQFSKNSDKLKIVASIFPYYDFAKTVAGDRAEIKMLLSPGNEPHSYDPSPSDIVAIENCDIFIYNGGESDEWVEGVLDSLENKNIKILCMMDYITPEFEQEIDHTKGDEYDEHIWTSLRNAQILVKTIADQMIELDEENAEYYYENALNYINQLYELDKKATQIVANAKSKTLVFGDRFPFLYFVTDYGLDYQCAFPGCSSETEPSIATVTHLIDYIRDNKIPVVLYLDFSNGKIANLIAEDTGAKTLKFSSCHNVTKDEFKNKVSYYSLMEKNINVLKEALG